MTKKILVMLMALMMVVGIFGCAAKTEEAAAPAAGETPYKAAFITQALSNESQAYSWKQFQQYGKSGLPSLTLRLNRSAMEGNDLLCYG